MHSIRPGSSCAHGANRVTKVDAYNKFSLALLALEYMEAVWMEAVKPAPELSLFLASTVHDMKNSISVLGGTLERLLDGATPETERAYAQMAQMLYQTRRLNDSLMQLLALYKKVGTPAYPFDMQPLEAELLVEQVVAVVRVLLTARGITLELDTEPDLIMHVDEDLIVGVIAHALHNASHYTRDRIRLSVRGGDDGVVIRVEDNGEGFPQQMLDAAAPAPAASGVNFLSNSAGLGLFFASEVARMHQHRGRHGSVHLHNGGTLGGGCFVLTLP